MATLVSGRRGHGSPLYGRKEGLHGPTDRRLESIRGRPHQRPIVWPKLCLGHMHQDQDDCCRLKQHSYLLVSCFLLLLLFLELLLGQDPVSPGVVLTRLQTKLIYSITKHSRLLAMTDANVVSCWQSSAATTTTSSSSSECGCKSIVSVGVRLFIMRLIIARKRPNMDARTFHCLSQ